MKKVLLIIIMVLNFISVTPARADECEDKVNTDKEKYLNIWKEMFLQRNALDEKYFNDHISVFQASANCWNEGIGFKVIYDVTIGWAKIRTHDDLPVAGKDRKIMTEDEIKHTPPPSVFYETQNIKNYDKLFYDSEDDAIDAAADKTGDAKFIRSYFVYYRNLSNHPYMEVYFEKDRKKNQCPKVRLDLITGEAIPSEGVCMMF